MAQTEQAKTTLMRCKTLPSGNQYFHNPFIKGEVVKYIGEADHLKGSESFRKQFIVVYRTKHRETHTLSRSYFQSLTKATN